MPYILNVSLIPISTFSVGFCPCIDLALPGSVLLGLVRVAPVF